MRNKSNLAVAKSLGASTKPRAVLGDICNNVSVSTNAGTKSDDKDVQLKKPAVKPPKKSATEW